MIETKKLLSNVSWILLAKITSLALKFITTIWVANYLGSYQYGIIAYSVSFVTLISSIGGLGLDGIVVKELKLNEKIYSILGTSFILKFIGYFFAFILIIIISINFDSIDADTSLITIIVGISILFQASEVVDYWFNSKVLAKKNSVPEIISTISSGFLKLFFIGLKMSLIWFAFIYIIEKILRALFRIRNLSKEISISKLRFHQNKAKFLLSESKYVFIGSILAIIYLKVDQIMIKWLLGNSYVGKYALAASISEAFYLVPSAIILTLFPAIVTAHKKSTKDFNEKIQSLLNKLVLGSLVLIGFIYSISPILKKFLSSEYQESIQVLQIHIWACLFIFMRLLYSKWIIIERKYLLSLISQGSGAISNVLLNLLLIPRFGIQGAAVSTVISYGISGYFSLMIHQDSRKFFIMMSKSLFNPLNVRLHNGY